MVLVVGSWAGVEAGLHLGTAFACWNYVVQEPLFPGNDTHQDTFQLQRQVSETACAASNCILHDLSLQSGHIGTAKY